MVPFVNFFPIIQAKNDHFKIIFRGCRTSVKLAHYLKKKTLIYNIMNFKTDVRPLNIV